MYHVKVKLEPRTLRHVNDIRLEAALSVIMDLEDSVACVDAEDKVVAYRNWLGLMKGDLAEEVTKGGKTFTRALNPDRAYQWPGGGALSLKGRVTDAGSERRASDDQSGECWTATEREVFEGLLDAMVTTLIGMHDLVRDGGNSVEGSIYVVKPKMHGPDEVAFTDDLFTAVEAASGSAAVHSETGHHG